jgi:cytoskeleton protein RodZ
MDQGVGKALREARRRRKLDLSDVAEATKIRARFLRALEEEEWGQLPGDAYARAFIRTYASHLGLDGEEMAERQRRLSGSVRPSELLPRGEPAQAGRMRPRGTPSRAWRRIPAGAVAAVAVVSVAAIALAIAGSDSGSPSRQGGSAAGQAGGDEKVGNGTALPSMRPGALSLQLTATAEVWVCLLDASGEALVDGQILSAGSVEGPFQSGSFTVSFGNGEVDMTVDGQQATIPETASPIGFTIGRGGSMRELSEGERPTCT